MMAIYSYNANKLQWCATKKKKAKWGLKVQETGIGWQRLLLSPWQCRFPAIILAIKSFRIVAFNFAFLTSRSLPLFGAKLDRKRRIENKTKRVERISGLRDTHPVNTSTAL